MLIKSSHLVLLAATLLLTTCCHCFPSTARAVKPAADSRNCHSEKQQQASQQGDSTGAATTETTPRYKRMDEEQEQKILKDSEAIKKPVLHFTRTIFNKVRIDDENAILSPLSIHAALNLVLLGAKPESVTDRELRMTLGYPEDIKQEQLLAYHQAYKNAIYKFKEISKEGLAALEREKDEDFRGHGPPVVDIYNTIITKAGQPLLAEYSEQTSKYYNSTVEMIDPSKDDTIKSVVDKINNWGKEAGFGQDILTQSELREHFSALLLSAIRVQAFWGDDFHEREIKDAFYNYGVKEKLVEGTVIGKSDFEGSLIEFTSQDKAQFKRRYKDLQEEAAATNSTHVKDLNEMDFNVISLPMKGGADFVIFVPRNNDHGDELKRLSNKLLEGSRLETALQMLDQLKASQMTLNYVTLPKFGFENNIDLIGPLKSIGLHRVFDNSASELSQMMQNHSCFVDRVKHQAMVEVNKFGIKAAGVTKIRMIPLMARNYPEPVNVHVKHPFMFVIRYQQMPLFIGQLVKI